MKTADSNELNIDTKSDNILFAKIDNTLLSHYNIDLEHGGNMDQTLHIDYCYYLNDETITSQGQSISASDLKRKSTGGWELKNNSIVSKTKGSNNTIDLCFCQFFIKSQRHQNNGNIDIILDGEEIDSISLYHTKKKNDNNLDVFVYKSPEICGEHKLILRNHDDRMINIAEFKYVPLPAQ